jgi:hypothetical protein
MRSAITLAAVFVFVCLAADRPVGADEKAAPPKPLPEGATALAAGELTLKYKPARRWSYELPAAAFRKVAGAIDLTAAGGATFATAIEGSALTVDTDGDGKADVTIEGESGYVRLRTKTGFDYSVRLKNEGKGWFYAASGARVGKLGETRITLIDQDGDGRYDGVGRDAMIVGSSRTACFLSRTVNVAGALLTLQVAPDGGSLRHTPYAGKAGRLDLMRNWDAQARLQSAIVRSADGEHSFDLARHHEGLAVPAGRYVLHGGQLGLGKSTVRFRRGNAKPIVVAEGKTTAVLGGGPLSAEFAYQRRGGEVILTPDSLRWFGRGGEEYFAWKPFGKSPEFTIADTKIRKEIGKAIFTGC